MTIQEKDFKLEPLNDTSFDIYFWKEGKNPGYKIDGYGLHLDAAIRRIAAHRIAEKIGDKAVTMKEYLKEWRSMINEVNEVVYGEDRK